MAEASIPVNLFNPGQVFACMGFLEAADVLLGDAEGGFDWSGEADVHFRLRAGGDENPFCVVLDFLAVSKVKPYAPPALMGPPAKEPAADDDENAPPGDETVASETFPGPKADHMALPILLVGDFRGQERHIYLGHWADASNRNAFKLYAGNRSAANIARAMLYGTGKKPKRQQREGEVKTLGLSTIWSQQRLDLEKDPFGVVTPVGGSFNFDPRGAWTGIDAGYSPNEQKHGVAASPVVEILSAIGLEHSRPDEYETRKVRYAAWGCLLPPILARPALGGANLPVPWRTFRFDLDLSGKNKVVTFAQEEVRP